MAVVRVIPEGDIELDAGRPVIATGAAYVRQKLSARFRFFLGEWFLDLREGVPYYRDVFVQNPDIDVIRTVFAGVIRSVAEVATITRLEPAYDSHARRLAFDFEVTLKTGETIIVSPTDTDFILDLQAAA